MENVKDMRKLYDAVEREVRCLKNLGLDSKNYGALLTPIIMSKLPEEMKLIVTRQFGDELWDIELILKAYKKEFEAREKIMLSDFSSESKPEEGVIYSGMSLYTESEKGKKSTEQQNNECIFCNKAHRSYKCTVVSHPRSRKAILISKRACFICLKVGHSAKSCNKNWTCMKCKGRHNTCICVFRLEKSDNNDSKETASNVNSGQSNEHSVLLQTATASASGENGTRKKLRILFDSGSQMSYITQEASSLLGLERIYEKTICIKTFGGGKTEKSLDGVRVKIHTKFGTVPINAFVSEICYPLRDQNISVAKNRYPHLRDLDLADCNPSNIPLKVDILIGCDYYWSFIGNIIKRGKPGEPVAIQSKLGYILSGNIRDSKFNFNSQVSIVNTHVLKISEESIDVNLNETVKNFWNIENTGIDKECTDNSIMLKFSESIRFENNRYSVSLPFQENHALLEDDFELSKNRLKNLTKRTFLQNKSLLKEYDSIIKQQLSENIIDVAPDQHVVGGTHYLPHRAVVKDQKSTTKIRIVFDASAKTQGGVSLNQCLQTGPNLNTLLFNVLLKFRVFNVAIVADIEKAFLQIGVNAPDRDFLRFLWFKDINNINFENFNENDLIEYRFCRVLFGATCSPFLLSATLLHHFNQYKQSDAQFVNKVLNALHVDDLSAGERNDIAAYEFFVKTKERLSTCGFNLRKFQSNSAALESSVEKEFPGSTISSNADNNKVLGVLWDKTSDKLCFDFKEIQCKLVNHPTKREVLIALASIYDPIGLINPIVVVLKVLFQNTCARKIKWDENLPEDLLKQWTIIVCGIKSFGSFEVNRVYSFTAVDDPFESIQIHGFSDASKSAYGCCIYLRFLYKSNNVKVSLVTSKSKVCPLKSQSIPRLELLGTVLLHKLLANVKSILEEIAITDVFAWTDSSVVYCWIKNEHKIYKPFVQNRLNLIRSNLIITAWKLIKSRDNPADIISRGASPTQLRLSSWFQGPPFLIKPEMEWPQLKPGDNFSDGNNELVAKNVNTCINTTETSFNGINLTDVIEINKFSSFHKLIRVLASVYKFIRKLKQKANNKKLEINNKTSLTEEYPWLTANECLEAKNLLLKEHQKLLTKNEKWNQTKVSLDVFSDQHGLFRCGGRLGNAPLPYNTKFPILLFRDDYLTELIIQDAHVNVGHNGVNETLSQIRSSYWIPKGRQTVKKVINKCGVCRRYEGICYSYPNPPDLPSSRLKQHTAFSNIGIDYAGPVFVKNNYGGNKDTFKAWIALIVCQSSRAIYIDIATDYSSQSCINVLRRFFSRRGTPELIISDNGTSFTGVEVQDFISKRNVQWKFNIEAAPWTGGFYERMVQSVKRILKKILGRACITQEQMLTILYEIEKIVNNRPLMYVNNQLTDDPLTPSHLVCGRKLETNFCEENESVNTLLDHFWSRWLNEYVTNLRESHKSKLKSRSFTPSVGDIVLIYVDKVPRSRWRLGKIEQLLTSKDGNTRSAILRTVSKHGSGITRRPISHLYPLETQT